MRNENNYKTDVLLSICCWELERFSPLDAVLIFLRCSETDDRVRDCGSID